MSSIAVEESKAKALFADVERMVKMNDPQQIKAAGKNDVGKALFRARSRRREGIRIRMPSLLIFQKPSPNTNVVATER